MDPYKYVVKEGTFLYDGTVECDLRITYSPMQFGTGEYEDAPEICEDVERDTYYLHFGSTTQRGVYTGGGGGYPTLAEAIAAKDLNPSCPTR